MKIKFFSSLGTIIFLVLLTGLFRLNLTAAAAIQTDVQACLTQLPFEMPEIEIPEIPGETFNLRDFGAVGDGHTLNTEAFAKAISACVASGGGTVVVPPGIWLTGPIQLQSHLNLHLERGALILFTPDRTQYPIIKVPQRGFLVQSPVYGANLENVAITGEGILDGFGEAWRPVKKFKMTEAQWKNLVKSGGVVNAKGDIWWPSQEALDGEKFMKKLKAAKKKSELTAEDHLPARDYLRPYMVLLVNCQKVLIDRVTIQNSPKFALVPNWCHDVVIRGVKINNEWWAQNGDGIDIHSCKNVLVHDCTVTAGDDGICMKSGRSKSVSQPSLENVVISDCVVYHGHGGFVIGSNTDGGMKNILVRNCNFIGTDIGLRFKSARDRGGLVENIFIQNIFMKNIVEEAILFDTFYENAPQTTDAAVSVTELTPRFEKFYLKDIYCVGASQAMRIAGLPEMPVREISLENFFISAKTGFSATCATGLTLKNVKIIPEHGEIFQLAQSTDFIIENGFCPSGTPVFLKISDRQTRKIILKNTDLTPAKIPVEYGPDANPAAVIFE